MLAPLLFLAAAAAAEPRGFPLYFGSFENVGEGEIGTEVIPAKIADDKITEWTRGCPADVYVLINDHNPFDLKGLKRVHKAAENSLTRGSFLTSKMVDLAELALDLQDYCEAELVQVNAANDKDEISRYMDTRVRVFYIEIPKGLPDSQKDDVLTHVFGILPSPYVTVCYVSAVQQGKPVLRSVTASQQRLQWKDIRNKKDKIRPIIAPLFDRQKVGHQAPEPVIDLPDNFFLTLVVGSVFFALFLAYRDWVDKPTRQRAKNNAK